MISKVHNVESVEFQGPLLVLRVDGHVHRFPTVDISSPLTHASEAERRFYRVSPAGYGVHWPELDEDLCVDGLIRAATGQSTGNTSSSASVLKEEPKS
jgi:hypothetical protein